MSATDQSQAEATSSTGQRFRNWKAVLDLQPIVQPEPLRVRGEYHLNHRCGGVALREAVPQGINPRILLLSLIEAPGDGGDWVEVAGQFAAKEGQYDSVMVRDDTQADGQSISIDIEEVH